MILECPRCHVGLHRRGAGDATAMHACEKCHGVFIDGSELMTVCRTLAHLPDRREEVRLMGTRGSGIAACPRCADAPYELEILAEKIDFCIRCSGTWLDGPEVEAMAVDLDARPTRHVGGYRNVVEDAPDGPAVIACSRCHALAPVKEAFVTLGGFICVRCHMDVGVSGGLVTRNAYFPEEAERAMAAQASESLTAVERERVKSLRAPVFFRAVARWVQDLFGRPSAS